MIDPWVFSHGSTGSFRASKGIFGQNTSFTVDDIYLAQKNSGFSKLPIRMVYQVNCYGSSLIQAWRSVGAKVVLGARLVNFFPYEFKRFAYQWNHGRRAKGARNISQDQTPKEGAYIVIREWGRRWGGCPLGYYVLGTSEKAKECGEKYFTEACPGHPLPWRGDGKRTMVYSSHKVIRGDLNIKKSTVPRW